MAYIPTVEEFNENYPVARWDRNTVADGKWLQENTIGPLSARDDFLLSLFEDLEGGDSWKKWSEKHNSSAEYSAVASAIYIGPNNKILGSGHAYVVGENNTVSATTNKTSDSRGGSYVFGMDNYVNDGFVIGNQVTANMGSKVIGRDVSATKCSTVIGYNVSADDGSLALTTPTSNSSKKIVDGGSLLISIADCDKPVVSKNGSINISRRNASAIAGGILIGGEDAYIDGSLGFGRAITASGGGTIIGSNGNAGNGSIIIKNGGNNYGNYSYAEQYGIVIGNGASAKHGALAISINNNGNIYSENGGIAIGTNASAEGGAIAINGYVSTHSYAGPDGLVLNPGHNYNSYAANLGFVFGGGSAQNCAAIIGNNNIATYGSYAFGVENNVSYGSFSFGFRNIIDHSATNFGEDNSASNMATVFGNSNEVNNNSFNFGNYNTVNGYSINLGNNNSATEESVIFGNNNSANNNSFNFGNTNILDNHSINFGSKNVSEKHSVTFGEYNSAYNSIILGDFNESHCEPYLIKKNLVESAVSSWQDGGAHPDISKTSFELNGILSTKNVLIGFNNSAINTRNAYLIGNNNYSETTIDDLELDCDIYSTATKGQDNDGFTLAFGLANSAIRNYDIAIGKETLASGGENIVIGAPYTALNNIQYHIPREDDEGFISVTSYVPTKYIPTKSIGYKNLNIRSNIDGVSNIAFESILSGFELSSYNSNNTNIGAIHNTLIQSEVNIKNITGTGNLFVRNKFYNCSNGNFDNISGGIEVDANNKNIKFISNSFDRTNLISITNNNNSLDFCYNNFDRAADVKISANEFHGNNIIGGNNNKPIMLSGYGFYNNIIYDISHNSNNILANNGRNNILYHFNTSLNITATNSLNDNLFTNLRSANTDSNNIKAYNITDNIFKHAYIDNLINYININDNIISNNLLNAIGRKNINSNASFVSNILLNNNRASDLDSKQTQIILSDIDFASFNIITNSRISAYLNGENEPEESVFCNNLILNSIVNCELFGANDASAANFTNNYAFNSYIESKYENKNKSEAFKNNPVQNNVIFNYSALNTNGSLAFCDGFGGGTNNVSPILNNCNAVISLGQNQIEDSVETSVYGYDNNVVFAERLYILGQHNNISADVNRDNLIAGSNNNISGDIADTIDRNTILGNGNTLSGQFVDCNILGDCNELNNETETVFENDTLIGLHNKVEFGSNSILIGQHNIVNGYNGIVIGEGLSATNSQVVVGRFNALCEGTDDRENHSPNSGVLFIVGNGTHTEPSNYTEADVLASYEEANIQRSNAMIVSADGTVSARTYKADPTTPLGKLFNFLSTATLEIGTLKWTGSDWTIQQ